MKRHLKLLATGLLPAVALLQACTTVTGVKPGEYPPAPPPQFYPQAADGAVYQTQSAMSLFEDVKARQVGDTLTIVLSEATQASKNATTSADRNSSLSTGNPLLFGRTPTYKGDEVLSNEWETEQSFDGKGSSAQSNSLTGRITVTVADVLPNGNLYVRGEKWLTLNQGEEFVQISGIVRPADIGTGNEVASFKIADAKITYSGNGAVADANRPGILTRAFLKLWPL